MSYIYLIKNSEETYYKIGVGKTPNKRLSQLQTGNSAKLELIEVYKTEIPYKVEGVLHRRFSHFKKEGEWFDFSIKVEREFITNCQKIESSLKFLNENGDNMF